MKTITIAFVTGLLFLLPPCAGPGPVNRAHHGTAPGKTLYALEADRGDFNIFSDPETEHEVLSWQVWEHRNFGDDNHAALARKRKFKNTVVMQRSGRKRLYDHNIFLASLFDGRIIHKTEGDLGGRFEKAVFIDIGSGILCEEGAPTVRDIVEDDRIWVHLDFIIATDINGHGCRYVDTYRIVKRNLPFPVREITMKLNFIRDFAMLTHGLLKPGAALIFRSANSGPDLYYKPETLVDHFRTMIRACTGRDVLYLFNTFILYKSRNSLVFQKIGTVDPGVGTSHRGHPWEKIDWERRKLNESFSPNGELIEVRGERNGKT